VASVVVWSGAPAAQAQAACQNTSTGDTALPDLAGQTYMGVDGGLYPGGTNDPPAAYAQAGARAANEIAPLDQSGRPDPNGRIVLLSVGMSNASMEFQVFVNLAMPDAARDQHVVLVDGAQGGYASPRWTDPAFGAYDVVHQRLAAAGVTEQQVQAVWLKQSMQHFVGSFEAYTSGLLDDLRAFVDEARDRWPNLRQIFVSSRAYGGYVSGGSLEEPYVYWTSFADKFLVEDSISHPDQLPWIGWGPYLWTDGTRGRSDGFVWTCADVSPLNGTHPTQQGRMKVAELLRTFFDTSPFAAWYRGAAAAPGPTSGPGPSTGASGPAPAPTSTFTQAPRPGTGAARPGLPGPNRLPILVVGLGLLVLGGLVVLLASRRPRQGRLSDARPGEVGPAPLADPPPKRPDQVGR
jgi:hypothetical protein